jgi:isopenicillin-N N-acyltransferase-like protein
MRILDLGDDPFERGLVHGRTLAREAADNLETYLRRFEASGMSRDAALREGEIWEPAIAAGNPEYVEEMRGVAEGAGLPRAAVAFTLFGQDARKQELPASEPSGCSTFGVLPEATTDGSTWLGQNWDWLAGIHGRTVVLRIARRAKPSLVCLTEAGIVGGKMGMNEHGIGLVENGLACDSDGRYPYEKPFHVRCREVLDADRFDQALLPILATRRTASANFVVGHRDGEVIDLETSPDHVSFVHPRDGIVAHSNHFLDPRHGASLMERTGPNTLYRAARLDRALRRNVGRLGFDDFRTAFGDHFSAPNAVCRHPDERQPEAKRTMTLASVLLDLKRLTMHVAEGPPCSNAYQAIPLDRPLSAAAE